jgi:hypothetical protein
MTPRFICPHCRSPIAPVDMEIAHSADAQYRVCPVCDEPIVLFLITADCVDESTLPAVKRPLTYVTESCRP